MIKTTSELSSWLCCLNSSRRKLPAWQEAASSEKDAFIERAAQLHENRAPLALVGREDSLEMLLRQQSGHAATPTRLRGDTSPVSPLQGTWLSRNPDILAAGEGLYFQSDFTLGEGSSGKVSLGIAVGTGALMAVKRTSLAHPSAQAAQDVGERLARLGSPMAPQHMFCADDSVYFIEALGTSNMSGLDLSLSARVRHGLAWIVADGVLPELVNLHANNQAHCDIKPDNIMQRASRVQLIDYDRVQARDAQDYETTYWYAPPETFHLQKRGGLDKLDCWCLGTSLWEIASGLAADDIMARGAKTFFGHNWRTPYAALYPDLVANQKPPLSEAAKQLWDAFAQLKPNMRSVILGLMHPYPDARRDPRDALKQLHRPEALAECDIEGARKYLRHRAKARTRQLLPAIGAAQKQLHSHRDLIENHLGSMPAWLEIKRGV